MQENHGTKKVEQRSRCVQMRHSRYVIYSFFIVILTK